MRGADENVFRPKHAYRVLLDFDNGEWHFIEGEYVVPYMSQPQTDVSRRYRFSSVDGLKTWIVPEGRAAECWTDFFVDIGDDWSRDYDAAFVPGNRYRAKRDYRSVSSHIEADEAVIYLRHGFAPYDQMHCYSFCSEHNIVKWWNLHDQVPPASSIVWFEDNGPSGKSVEDLLRIVREETSGNTNISRQATEPQTSLPTKARGSLKWPALGCLIIGLAGLAPMISVLISIQVAKAFGCALDEGGVHPCLAYGHDIGEQLNVMFVLGWLQLVTWPAVAVAILGGLVLAIIAMVRPRK